MISFTPQVHGILKRIHTCISLLVSKLLVVSFILQAFSDVQKNCSYPLNVPGRGENADCEFLVEVGLNARCIWNLNISRLIGDLSNCWYAISSTGSTFKVTSLVKMLSLSHHYLKLFLLFICAAYGIHSMYKSLFL